MAIFVGRSANISAYKRFMVVLVLILLFCLNNFYIGSAFAQTCQAIWNVKLFGIKASYQPREAISGRYEFQLNNASDNPNPIRQIVIGLVDQSGSKVIVVVPCIYDGVPKVCPEYNSGNGTFTFNAPDNPGTYRIVACNFYQYSCADAQKLFPATIHYTKELTAITVSVTQSKVPQPSPIPPTPTKTTPNPTQSLVETIGKWVEQIAASGSQPKDKAISTPDLPQSKPTEKAGTSPPVEPLTTPAVSNWLEKLIPILMTVTAILLIGIVSIRYLIVKRRSVLDKSMSLILLVIAVGYLCWIYVIPIIIAWFPIVVVSVIIIVGLIILWKTGVLKPGGAPNFPPFFSGTNAKAKKEGYIYMIRCRLHEKDLYKIGRTKNHPDQRIEELDNTGVPEKFMLIQDWKVTDDVLAESLVHKALDRYRTNKEYFKARASIILRIIDETIKDLVIS
jgi:hypothetical protein